MRRFVRFARGVALRLSICVALVLFVGGLQAVAQESQHGDEGSCQ